MHVLFKWPLDNAFLFIICIIFIFLQLLKSKKAERYLPEGPWEVIPEGVLWLSFKHILYNGIQGISPGPKKEKKNLYSHHA